MQNIGVVFVKMGQYSDAITSYEHIMLERPDYKTAFNLILCYYATGDRDKMKKTFMRLLQVDLNLDDEDKYLPHPVSFPSLLSLSHVNTSTVPFIILRHSCHAGFMLEVLKNYERDFGE